MSKRTHDEMSAGSQETGFPTLTADLLTSGKFSDLQIKCQGHVWNEHRLVICLQSKPLAAVIDGAFLESITKIINLEDDEKEMVDRMIKFLYAEAYDDGRKMVSAGPTAARKASPRPSPSSGIGPPPPTTTALSAALLTNAKVWILGDKYDIPKLKDLAKKKYEEVLPMEWKNTSFVQSLKVIYDGTPENDRGLKDLAIKFAGKKAGQLAKRIDFEEIFKERPEIGFDVFKASLPFSWVEHTSGARVSSPSGFSPVTPQPHKPACITCKSSTRVVVNDVTKCFGGAKFCNWHCLDCRTSFG